MVSEKLQLFDINYQQLKLHLQENILKLEPMRRSPAVSGWSIQSADGTYQDGWQTSFLPYNGPGNQNPSWNPETEEQKNIQTMQDYFRRTDICQGPFVDILNAIENLGFHPRRARIIKLAAGSEGQWHQDGSKHHYQVRLHIPIITNPACLFENDEGSENFACDGFVYLVHINRRHRVVNKSSEDRYHLVMNIWDTEHRSKLHRY